MPKEWTEEERQAASVRAKEHHEARRLAQSAQTELPPVEMAPIPREGEAPLPVFEEPAAPPETEGEPEDAFARFLMAQDAETRELLSDIELRVIYEQETKRAADEKKAAAKKGALAKAQRHARMVAGLIPAEQAEIAARLDRLNQKVTWTVNMPEAGKSGMLVDVGVRIDGKLLYHGQRVTGTLAQYESYREIEWRAHQNELDFQGQSRLSRLRRTAIGALNNDGPRL